MVASKGKYGGLLVEMGSGDPGASPSVGPTLRAVAAKDGFQNAPGNPTNLYEVFENSVKRFGDRPCLGKRIDGKGAFVFETYKVSQRCIPCPRSSVPGMKGQILLSCSLACKHVPRKPLQITLSTCAVHAELNS